MYLLSWKRCIVIGLLIVTVFSVSYTSLSAQTTTTATQESAAKAQLPMWMQGVFKGAEFQRRLLTGDLSGYFRDTATGNHTSAEETVVRTAAAVPEALNGLGADFVEKILSGIGRALLTVGSGILFVGGTVMNATIQITIGKIGTFMDLDGIKVAWTALRDVANISFIFILLYAAISTILGSGANTKTILKNTIVAAIIINFSFFITQVVIDAANILTLSFVNAIVPNTPNGLQGIDGGFTGIFMNALQLQSIYNSQGVGLEGQKMLYLGICGFILMTVVAVLFIIMAVMLITRLVMLMILVILSPVAFASTALPNTSGKVFRPWLSALIGQCFFAPVFFLMTWVTLTIIKGTEFFAITGAATAGKSGWTALFLGGGQAVELLANFFIIIAFMISSIVLAKKVADTSGGMANKAAGSINKFVGGAVVGGTAWASRNTVGRFASRVADSDKFKDWAARSSIGRGAYKATAGIAGSSFDVRGSKAFGKISDIAGAKDMFGKAGGAGGYEKKLEGQVKSRKEFIDKLGKGSISDRPEIQRDLIVQRTNLERINREIGQHTRALADIPETDLAARSTYAEIIRRSQEEQRTAQDEINDLENYRSSDYSKQLLSRKSNWYAFGLVGRKDKEGAQKVRDDYRKSSDKKAMDTLIKALGKSQQGGGGGGQNPPPAGGGGAGGGGQANP